MTNKQKEYLLSIDNREHFEEELLKISIKYMKDLKVWDEDLINHYLNISNMSRKQFEWSFKKTPPIDSFKE